MYYLSWLKSKFLNERTAKLDEAQRNGYTSIGDLEGKFLLFETLSFNFILCKKLGEMELLSSSSVRLFNGLSKYTDVTFRP